MSEAVFELPPGAKSMCCQCLTQATHFVIVDYSFGSLRPVCTRHIPEENA